MGKKTKTKDQEAALKESEFQASFARYSKVCKQKVNTPAAPLVTHFQEFSSSFVANPADFVLNTKSSNRDKQLLLFARFIFGKYPVPKILEQVWATDFPKNPKFDYKKWYICIATGGSLYKEYVKDILTKKEAHNFLQCKLPLDLNQALVYSIAKSHGAQEGLAFRIARSNLSKRPFNEFWKGCIRFFATEGFTPESVEKINDLTDYLQAKIVADRNFSIVGFGYTLNSILKKMKDWHYELRRIKVIGNHHWEGHALPDREFNYTDEKGYPIVWHFKQLKTSKELATEGNAMHHCVYSYRDRCISGACSIWSVKTVDYFGVEKRRVTVELLNNGHIAQIRGFGNRIARNEEKRAIEHWNRTINPW